MRHGLFSPVFLIPIALMAFSACGSESSGVASDQSVTLSTADETDTSLIINVGDTYSIADFEAVGYKKVTQFDLETLPGATDAWGGYF